MKNKIHKHNGKLYKMCKNCKIPREIIYFHKNGISKSGAISYRPLCKYCRSRINKNQRIADPELGKKETAYTNKWREKNREEYNAKCKQKRNENIKLYRERERKSSKKLYWKKKLLLN